MSQGVTKDDGFLVTLDGSPVTLSHLAELCDIKDQLLGIRPAEAGIRNGFTVNALSDLL